MEKSQVRMADQAMYHQGNQCVFVGGRLWTLLPPPAKLFRCSDVPRTRLTAARLFWKSAEERIHSKVKEIKISARMLRIKLETRIVFSRLDLCCPSGELMRHDSHMSTQK